MARKRQGRNQSGLGTLEYLKSGKCRFRQKVNLIRLTGPAVEPSGSKEKDWENAKRAFDLQHNPPAPETTTPTLARFLQSRIDGELQERLAPKTLDLYQRIYDNYILTHPIGKVPINKLGAGDIEGWKMHLLSKMEPTSVQRYMQFVAAQIKAAKRLRLITANPFDDVTLPKRGRVDKRVLSKSELNAFYKLKWNPKMKIAIRLLGHGLRKSEACGLKYEDFDGDGVLVVRQAIEVAGELKVTPLKTANSERWVPVDSELKKMLKKGKGWVLEGAKGQPLRGRTLHGWWHDTLEGTEFEGMTPHDLRSTFGMLLLEAGADVRTSAEMLGHSPEVLARIYARSRKEIKVAALEKIKAMPTRVPTKRKKA